MTFRSRLLLACVPLAVIPIALVAIGVRREVNERVRAQYDARIDGMARVIEEDLAQESRAITKRLASLSEMLADDNRLRLQLLGADAGDRRYLLDYAGRAMRLAGLDMLQLHDETGRILSSGHFRNDFDRADPVIVEALHAARGRAVADVRTADRTFPALLHTAEVQIGARTFTLIGGTALDRGFLANLDRGAGLSVALEYPDEEVSLAARGGGQRAEGHPATRLVREIQLPLVASGPASPRTGETAALVITQSLEPLRQLRQSIDRWFFTVTGIAAVVALVLASWAASRLSRPLADLAHRTRRLDLDRLDVDFRSARRGRGPRATHVAWGEGEVGTLSRTLAALTDRLRASVSRLREAERRATIGDIARQVNHDVRNGLTPIRNVVRHLAEVARNSPTDLPGVFLDRERTLDASVDYLHSLAGNYARLSPRLDRQACDIGASLRDLLNGMPETDRSRVRVNVTPGLPPVNADPVALRRILENVVTNALESLEPGLGRVTVSLDAVPSPQPQPGARDSVGKGAEWNGAGNPPGTLPPPVRRLQIVVADNGHGMTREQMSKVFDDFYTTKERGSGLGLSIVRRLVNDLTGRIAVDSEPGGGTRFTIELPADGASHELAEASSLEARTRNPEPRAAQPTEVGEGDGSGRVGSPPGTRNRAARRTAAES